MRPARPEAFAIYTGPRITLSGRPQSLQAPWHRGNHRISQIGHFRTSLNFTSRHVALPDSSLLATGRHPITAAAAHRHDRMVICEWCQQLCILGGLGTLGEAHHPAGDGVPEASHSLVSGHPQT